MKSGEKDDITKKASDYMKQCGVPNKLHSQMLFSVCEIVHQDKNSKKSIFKSLISSVNIIKGDVWDHALRIVFNFLKESQMKLTLSTMKIEDNHFQDDYINKLMAENDVDKSTDEIFTEIINTSSSEKYFHDLVLSFLNDLPLKNPIDISKELYPDINSSESLGIDNSNIMSDDNSSSFNIFHDD